MKALPLLRRLGFLFSCSALSVLVPTGCDVKVDVEEGDGDDEVPGDCKEQYVWCLDQGHSAEDCAPLLAGCEQPPPPLPDPGDCELQLNLCLEAGVEPHICEEKFLQCVSPQPPPDDCKLEVELCLQQGQPYEVCVELCPPHPCPAITRRQRPPSSSPRLPQPWLRPSAAAGLVLATQRHSGNT